jgi:diguanylate cyclase (GGDEF)-like protein
MAQYDSLTGLPNRSMYLDRLEHGVAQSHRSGALIAVLFIDLDHFKVVNDTYGHGAGDDVLVQAAQRLKDCLRAGDTVGRLGGDEFAAVLGDLACANDAASVARKIVDALTSPFSAAGHELHVSASIGISLFPGDGSEARRLLMNADMAMYRSKELGRNRYAFFGAEGSASASADSASSPGETVRPGCATPCQPAVDAIVHKQLPPAPLADQ